MNEPWPRFHLQLLGGFRLIHAPGPDAQELRIASRKTQALLAFLCLESSRNHSRESLATLFWGDRMDEQARHSLRQALTELRKTLEPDPGVLTVADDKVSVDVGKLNVDVLDIEEQLLSDESGSIQQAIETYNRPLLDNFSVGAELFDSWLGERRVRLHQLVCEAEQKLATRFWEEGNAEAATAAAKHLLALDAAREESHRLLMRIHAAAGRRTEALRQYQLCVKALRREFDAEPSAATVRLHEDIRGGAKAFAVDSATGDASRSGAWIARRRRWTLGIVAAVGIGVLLVSGAVVTMRSPEPPSAIAGLIGELRIPDKPSIAVLPFRSLSDDPEQIYLADGLADDIITDLSRYHYLLVISGTSSFRYRDADVNLQQVSRELGVRYVLQGSLRRADGRVRVNTQLIDATTGVHVWAERFDRPETDFFALQDEIADRVVVALEAKLLQGPFVFGRRAATTSLEAYYQYRRADELWNQHNRTANERGIEAALKAIELDPKFTAAKVMLSGLYWQKVEFLFVADPLPWIEKLNELIRTIDYDNFEHTDFTTKFGRAIHYWAGLNDKAKGLAFAKQLYEEHPNNADAVGLYGSYLDWQEGRADESIALIKRSIRLEPYPESWKVAALGRMLLLTGRIEEAITAFKIALTIAPGHSRPRIYLIAALHLNGQKSEAQAQAKELLDRIPEYKLAPEAKRMYLAHPHRSERIDEIVAAARQAGVPMK